MSLKSILLALGGLAFLALLLFVIPMPVHSQVTSANITFTAPGDDGVVGTATSYDLRWSSVRPDTTSAASRAAWWGAASTIRAISLPAPKVAGSAESFNVTGVWTTGVAYYFVVTAKDEAGNESAWSNVAQKTWADTLPPSAILNLNVQ